MIIKYKKIIFMYTYILCVQYYCVLFPLTLDTRILKKICGEFCTTGGQIKINIFFRLKYYFDFFTFFKQMIERCECF
jgi:hypothetical protein